MKTQIILGILTVILMMVPADVAGAEECFKNALEFDGVDDYVRTTYEDGPSEYTITLWYNLNEDFDTPPPGIGKTLVSKTGDEVSKVDLWDVAFNIYGIALGNETTAGNYSRVGYNPGIFYKDEWHFVAATGTNTEGKIYFDGELKNTVYDNFVTGAWDDSVPFDIARPYLGYPADRYFNGKIDDVRIYNRILSAEEIQANMHKKLTGEEEGLVGYWDFDEGGGQIAYDLSTNGNNGVLGSTPEVDNSDPNWIESDAPVGTCAIVDIKPTSCPNPLNLKSKGVLPVAILGTDGFDVSDIDAASIRLAGVAAIRHNYEDVATPVSDANECACTTDGSDGFTDLVLKFKTQDIVEALINDPGQLAQGQVLTLTVTGELFDGSVIEEADCMVLVGNVSRHLLARRPDINDDGVVDMLDFMILVQFWLEFATY